MELYLSTRLISWLIQCQVILLAMPNIGPFLCVSVMCEGGRWTVSCVRCAAPPPTSWPCTSRHRTTRPSNRPFSTAQVHEHPSVGCLLVQNLSGTVLYGHHFLANDTYYWYLVKWLLYNQWNLVRTICDEDVSPHTSIIFWTIGYLGDSTDTLCNWMWDFTVITRLNGYAVPFLYKLLNPFRYCAAFRVV